MLKGQTRDSNTCRAQYLENSWRCCLVTVANVCEKVWSGAMNHGSARLGSTTHIRGLAPMIHLIKFSSSVSDDVETNQQTSRIYQLLDDNTEKQLCLLESMLSFCGLSVCLSVCLSRSCIVFKQQKTRHNFFCIRQPHISP